MASLAGVSVAEATQTASSVSAVSASAGWLNPSAVAGYVGIAMDIVLATVAVLALMSWGREKNFTIARNLLMALFELDREARSLKDGLMWRVLQQSGDLESGTASNTVDVSASFARFYEKTRLFQSALVEANGRWKTTFGLSNIGLFATSGIEYSLTKIAEVSGTAAAEEVRLRGSPPEEREKRAKELAQECMQRVFKCEEVLKQDMERFHSALDPLFMKHFSVPSIEQKPE